MIMSGLSTSFLAATAPLLTAITSYPAVVRISLPIFWAVILSSASRIFSGTVHPSVGKTLNGKVLGLAYRVNRKNYLNVHQCNRLDSLLSHSRQPQVACARLDNC